MGYRMALIGAAVLWSGVLGVGGLRAQTQTKKPTASAAVKAVTKDCGDGVKLQLSAGSAIQGTLILAQLTGVHAPANLRGEWDGADTPLWMEGKTNPSFHALMGVDLEKKPGAYEWKVSWTNAKGEPATCSIPITVRAGKFPTERLTVEKQFVQPDPEQEKRVAEEQKKTKAIYDTVTPEKLWDGKFRIPLDA